MPEAGTRESNPLRIAAVAPGEGHGRIGITLCPGKTDPAGMSGPWARHLDSDLGRYLRTGDPLAGSSDPHSAGNGSLMRLAPVALRFWNDRPHLTDTAAEQSRATHAAEEAVDACRAFAELLADAIAGVPRAALLAPKPFEGAPAVARIVGGSWRGRRRSEIRSSGYVVHTLEAALWSVARTGDFESAVLLAANLAEDADTVAAVTGQLAGALYGLRGIPDRWLDRLAWKDRLIEVGERLQRASLR